MKYISYLFYNKQKEFIIGIFIVFLLLGFFVFYEEPLPDLENEQDFQNVILEDTDIAEKEDQNKIIRVDVKGAVAKEGVYEVDEGSCVLDVIRLAGGLDDEADTSMVNLSKQVEDQMMIVIPTLDEMNVNSAFLYNDVSAIDDSPDLISINLASLAELQTLPGIGEKKALDIISYRDENGGFKELEDLKNVKGIGERTFENLKKHIKL